MAPLALAPALLVPFAEAIGIVTAGLSLAALSDLVSDYMEDNPEKSEMILGMLNPAEGLFGGGLEALFNKKSKGGEEEISLEEIKTKPKSKRSKKEIVLEALRKEKGNYASPDAEGNYADPRGRVIRGLADEGKITDKPDPNYDPSKKYQGYKKFFNKADGGMAGTKTYHQYHDQYVPMDSESMMYAHGGGVGSMMQPRQNYALAGFVEDESETFTPNNFGLQLGNNNVENQMAFNSGSLLDNRIKTMQGMEDQGYDQPNLQKLKDMDMKQFKEKGIPLSLDEARYVNANNIMNDGINYITRKDNYVSPTMDMKMNQSYKASPKDGIFKSLINNAMGSKPMRGLTSAYNFATDNMIGPLFAGVAGVANRYNPLSPGSQNYNPTLQGQVNMLNESGMLGDQSSPYKITGGRLAGKNLVSLFGSNDLGKMYSKDLSRLQRTLANLQKKPGSYQQTIESINQKIAQNKREAEEAQKAREASTASRARAAYPNVYARADASGFTDGRGGGFGSRSTGTNENFSNNTGRGRTGYSQGGLVTLRNNNEY